MSEAFSARAVTITGRKVDLIKKRPMGSDEGVSAGDGTTICEMNAENSKIPDMFESVSSSLSGILFSVNEP